MATSTMTTGGGGGDRKSASGCSICLEKFKNPKVLPCGHSFCESCLLPLIKFLDVEMPKVECPRCRKMAVEPSDGFPTNYDLLETVLEKIEDEGENKAHGIIKVSQSLMDINREQYERAQKQLNATLQKFKSPEIETLRGRHQECMELIMATNESITKFFKDLSYETTAIEEWMALTFESLTITSSMESFIRLPSCFDDERFERAFTSVQRKVSNLEQVRRAADIDEGSYEMEEPRNRGNGISSHATAPSSETPHSAAASSASNEQQETSGTRETWFHEAIVIDNKYHGFIMGKHGVRKHSIEDKYRCQLQLEKIHDSCLITIRGRNADLVKAAKQDIKSKIKASKPCFICNVEGHIARACPQRSMVPKDLHGDSSDRSDHGRNSNIAEPSSSQPNGFGQTSRNASIGGGGVLRMGFG